MRDGNDLDTDDDDLRSLFVPLREPNTASASASDVARVRAAAADPPSGPRRRLLLGGAGLVTTAAVAAAVLVFVVDRGRPGTFTGVAGARELLHAAANAARDDPAPGGWRRSTTQRVRRFALEGRRCSTCPVERAVLESSSTQQLWSGPRGEAYAVETADVPRAIQNEPLLRAQHALDPPTRTPEFRGTHLVAAKAGSDDRGSPLGLGRPGGLADPEAVPTDPRAIVQWAASQLRAQDRALQRKTERNGGGFGYSISWATRVSYALVDLATSPQLSGAQQAAAFEALADRPGVQATEAPSAFASPDRVAVRIKARRAAGSESFGLADRVIVFDRKSHRIVAEQSRDLPSNARPIWQFGEGNRRGRLRGAPGGGGGEIRYDVPVNVPGPGLDADGRRVTPLTRLLEVGRDGESIPSATHGHQRANGPDRK